MHRFLVCECKVTSFFRCVPNFCSKMFLFFDSCAENATGGLQNISAVCWFALFLVTFRSSLFSLVCTKGIWLFVLALVGLVKGLITFIVPA